MLVALLAGCAGMQYYAQSISGQLNLIFKAKRIPVVLDDPDTPQALKDKLGTVLEVRKFASDQLGLPDNKSYTRYVDVHRPYLLWNVFATPEFSLDPVTWCFPVAGCVSYRGYFSEANAHKYADERARAGDDVYVGGVPAYSTLGWFSDPVPNTVMHYPDAELAGLIFHELAHQQYYVKDDTAFNESYATAVELEGIQRWLNENGNQAELAQYRVRLARDRQVMDLLLQAKAKLVVIYQSEQTDDAKRRGKQATFDEVKMEYRDLSANWEGYRGFDRWFAQPLNNAHMVSVAAYHEYLEAFQSLLDKQHGDLQKFYREVESVGRLEPDLRRLQLQQLMDQHGSG